MATTMPNRVGEIFLSPSIIREGLFAARFALVGLCATATHIAVLWVLLNATNLHIIAANLAAFLTAFWVSFTGHYHWTFKAKSEKSAALKRFFAIACMACVGNTIVLATLIKMGFLTPFLAAIASIFVIPFFTFAASRFWGFKP